MCLGGERKRYASRLIKLHANGDRESTPSKNRTLPRAATLPIVHLVARAARRLPIAGCRINNRSPGILESRRRTLKHDEFRPNGSAECAAADCLLRSRQIWLVVLRADPSECFRRLVANWRCDGRISARRLQTRAGRVRGRLP